MLKQAHALTEEIIEWRRDFHTHPETGFDVQRTARIVADKLERLGYRVMVANGGKDAVETISKMGSGIDLVILDLIMPGWDGGKTFDRIRDIQPDLPVMLSSGYAINGQATEIMDRGCNGFIQKPFNLSEISQKVRKVLDEAKGSA